MAARRTQEEIARAAGYTVSPSEWVATGGRKGRTFVAYDPNCNRLPDDAGTERQAWRMAAKHAREAAHV